MCKCFTWKRIPLAAALLLAFRAAAPADEPKKPESPRIAMCSPLAVAPGTTAKIILRGWHLDKVTEVRSSQVGVVIKVLSNGTAAIPAKQDAKQIGDQQIELEITTAETFEFTKNDGAADYAQNAVNLTVIAPDGESAPHKLLVGGDGELPVIVDHEPNDGFRQAQQISFPQVIDGQIHADGNVDVFTFEIEKSATVTVELLARSLGSGLDGILSLYDANGTMIANNDDSGDSTDSRLDVELIPGRYFIALQDAHDHGGTAHPYRLVLRVAN